MHHPLRRAWSIHTRAIELGPPYVVVATDYDKLLQITDWITVEQTDCTARYLDDANSYFALDQANRSELTDLLGEDDCQQRLDKDANLIEAIRKGLLRRDLYELRATCSCRHRKIGLAPTRIPFSQSLNR